MRRGDLALGLTVLGAAGAGLLAVRHEVMSQRRKVAESLLDQLHQACLSYELDNAVYPPGDGFGSRDLARALSKPVKCRYPHPTQGPGPFAHLHPEGSFRNPIWPDEPAPWGVVHYRRNWAGARPPLDLWAFDQDGAAIHVPGP